jgi:hypothetical protein
MERRCFYPKNLYADQHPPMNIKFVGGHLIRQTCPSDENIAPIYMPLSQNNTSLARSAANLSTIA